MDDLLAFGTSDILQNIATLMWIHKDDPGMTEKITTAKLGYEIWSRLSGEKETEALRNHTIAGIVKYVKDNPNAKKEELQKEISRQIMAFASQVEKL